MDVVWHGGRCLGAKFGIVDLHWPHGADDSIAEILKKSLSSVGAMERLQTLARLMMLLKKAALWPAVMSADFPALSFRFRRCWDDRAVNAGYLNV